MPKYEVQVVVYPRVVREYYRILEIEADSEEAAILLANERAANEPDSSFYVECGDMRGIIDDPEVDERATKVLCEIEDEEDEGEDSNNG